MKLIVFGIRRHAGVEGRWIDGRFEYLFRTYRLADDDVVMRTNVDYVWNSSGTCFYPSNKHRPCPIRRHWGWPPFGAPLLQRMQRCVTTRTGRLPDPHRSSYHATLHLKTDYSIIRYFTRIPNLRFRRGTGKLPENPDRDSWGLYWPHRKSLGLPFQAHF